MNNQIRAALLALCSAGAVHADYIAGVRTQISGVSTYARGTVAGDVLVLTKDRVAGCEAGYYVNAPRSVIWRAALGGCSFCTEIQHF